MDVRVIVDNLLKVLKELYIRNIVVLVLSLDSEEYEEVANVGYSEMRKNKRKKILLKKEENLQVYTGKDLELFEGMGRQIGITIENALHYQDIMEKERLAEEMRLGKNIQISLLQQELPREYNSERRREKRRRVVKKYL